jgi:alpha-glucosidase
VKNKDMRGKVLAILLFCLSGSRVVWGQGAKSFFAESFTSGQLPEGWANIDSSTQGCAWVVTNQPYPGSYQYQQQAPPIASTSRGYHMQFQAGYMVDEDQPSWEKKGWYPNAYVRTGAINCSAHSSVILRFEQTFRYNGHHPQEGAGLYVGVSTDSIHWHDIDVRHGAPGSTDMFEPMKEEINITQWAAGQPVVYLRWYWKGFYSWYWMVDDISLSEGVRKDVSVVRLLSQHESDNVFGKADSIRLLVRNSGTEDITSDVPATFSLDGASVLSTRISAGSANPWKAGTEREVYFGRVDLSKAPVHKLRFKLGLAGDENASNDTLISRINAAATSLGRVDAFTAQGAGASIRSGLSRLRVIFYTKDVFRIWLAADGDFSNPAGSDIVNRLPLAEPKVVSADAGAYYTLSTSSCVLRIYKVALRFALYDKTNTRVIWEEEKPMVFGAHTTQFLARQPSEYFYGCGMQNGYFSHRGKVVYIEKGNGWDDGGRPNPAPFYMSTAGYGVLRNTFDAGKYAFMDTVSLSHNEDRFDAFYFYGPDLKTILDLYTDFTGKPFLMPRWALSMGDANCYNKPDRKHQPQTTPVVISKVADQYIAHDMPRGWILPNDGYGCGYVKLDSVVKELALRGFHTGLWTENGVERIATEVGKYGTRLCKLDVAWVGPGYKFALDACKAAYEGIENNSNARGFVWSVMGWAGTQRYSTVWSGDQSGNWEYIRFHIPTFTGAGLTAMNAASSDIDGIFRGSDSTYVRDLQWKCFIPVLMTMSGWAKYDKQPWVYGEPYTSINRKYLQLKMRLTPYMYTYCEQAHKYGVPATRAMVLEFPRDSTTWGTATQYQFMNGESFLVAPVYKSAGERDSIYLPAGTWYDYWSGERLSGKQWLRHYPAGLEKLPVFVKAGAIIPMYPAMDYDEQRPADTLTLDIYPAAHGSFNLYEDDGITREHRTGAYAITPIDQVLTATSWRVTVHSAKGHYTGKYERRVYLLELHAASAPRSVSLNGVVIPVFTSASAFDAAPEGAYFDAAEKGGLLHVKTGYLSTAVDQHWEIKP